MGIRQSANEDKIILALKRCVVETFSDSEWLELGYLTNSQDVIEGHPRLLRSLYFGDEDYDGNVLQVIPKIINDDHERLRVVENFVGLEDWLQKSDPQLHAEIYSTGEVFALNDIEEFAIQTDIAEFNRHVERIRNGMQNDPEQALGSAKELLESVLKSIVGLEGESAGSEDMHALLRNALRKLDLDVQKTNRDGGETIKRTLNNLVQIVVGVAEVRNLYGTGHGRYKSKELEIAHVKLMVNAATTVALFLIELSTEQQRRADLDELPW